MTIYFITGNKKKFEEVKAVFSDIMQLEVDLPEIQDHDPKKIIEQKLIEAFKHRNGQFIVEDTSLYLNCLNGLPGPFIKWFLHTLGNEGLVDIAKRYNDFGAEAKTVIGYAKSDKEIYFFEASVKGRIVAPKIESDFGWDPIFVPEGYSESFGEMSRVQKNSLSMRRLALNKLMNFLEKKEKK